jgi:hypothetical protein
VPMADVLTAIPLMIKNQSSSLIVTGFCFEKKASWLSAALDINAVAE